MDILFIGFGPHSRRIQFPYCVRHAADLKIDNLAILELKQNSASVKKELEKYNENVAIADYYTDSYIDKKQLSKIIKKHNIDHVILGTDPEHHFEYLNFLIKKSLNILMDKPIVAIEDSANKMAAAKQYTNHSRSWTRLTTNTLIHMSPSFPREGTTLDTVKSKKILLITT